MTFETYLLNNYGERILEGLNNASLESEDCTLPGRLLDDQTFDMGDGKFCRAMRLDVERVYYSPRDMECAFLMKPDDKQPPVREDVSAAGTPLEETSSTDKPSTDMSTAVCHDLAFILLFRVEFLTFRIDGDNVSDPAQTSRKYYAFCTADIDDGMLRNFQMTEVHDRNLMAELDIEFRRKQKELSRFPVMAMTNEELENRAEAFLERYCPEAMEVAMRVPVRTIFRREFGMKLECGNDEKRFAMVQEGCHRLWDASALKLLDLLDEGDGNPPFPEAMHRIMERNAKRTAAGILMPAKTLKQTVESYFGAYKEEVTGTRGGEYLRGMIYDLAEAYEVSAQAMKIRLEELGFVVFSGVLNHLDGEYVPSFTTSEETPAKCGRYLIGMSQLKDLFSKQPELLKLCEQGELAYIEGKLVLNQCQYVQVEAGEHILTPYARTHVDECCIRFRGMPGRGRKPDSCSSVIFEPGRMHRLRRSLR